MPLDRLQQLGALGQSMAVLFLAGMLVAIACGLAARFTCSAQRRRLIWQAAILALGGLTLCEATGLTPGILAACRATFASYRPVETASTLQSPEIAANTSPQHVTTGNTLQNNSDQAAMVALSLAGEADALAVQKRIAVNAVQLHNAPEQAGKLRSTFATMAETSAPDFAKPVAEVANSNWESMAGYLWLAVTATLLLRSLATRTVTWLKCRRAPAVAGRLQGNVRKLARGMGLRREVLVIELDEIDCPIACGIARPIVALPADFCDALRTAQQEAVLLHELAHHRAHDPLWLLAADLTCAGLWWHPTAWHIRRRFAEASELVADEASSMLPDGQRDLAESLVRFGQRLSAPRRAAFVSARGSGYRSALGKRVARLLNSDSPQRPFPHSRWRRLWLVGLSCVLIAVSVFGTAALRSPSSSSFPIGDNEMSPVFKHWKTSVAALATGLVFAPWSSTAQAEDLAERQPTLLLAQRDGDRPREGEKARDGDRPRDGERERDGERPREGEREADRPRDGDRPREGEREADRPRDENEWMQARRREHQELGQVGERIERALREARENRRPEEVAELEQKLRQVKEKRQEIEAMVRRHQAEGHGGPREDAVRRLRHLHAAAENLQAAGLEDQAHAIREQAHQLATRLKQAGFQPPRPDHDRPPPHESGERREGPGDEMHRLRSEVQVLRHELDELRSYLKGERRDNDDDESEEGERDERGDRD